MLVAMYWATHDVTNSSKNQHLHRFGSVIKDFTAKTLAGVRDIPMTEIESVLLKDRADMEGFACEERDLAEGRILN